MKSVKNNKKSKRFLLLEEIREISIGYFTTLKNERWSNWNFQNN